MTKIGVLGAGTWGTALARMLAMSGHDVTIWSAIRSDIDGLKQNRTHPNLPGSVMPEELQYSYEIGETVRGKELILFAVPSVYVRETARKCRGRIAPEQLIVDVAKGVEPGTNLTMTQVIAQELELPAPRLVALSGPTHAEEVARDLPTAIVAASRNPADAEQVQQVFSASCMRVYTNSDVIGIEIAGAMKNIIALACGIAAGIGMGDNARAALMTRGMAEITRLGICMGCNPRTFESLAGIGDLIVTCTSAHSRNNRCGRLIGEGLSVADAVKSVGMVVEGLNALPAAMELSEKYQAELPICSAVNDVVAGRIRPEEAITLLMNRPQVPEIGR